MSTKSQNLQIFITNCKKFLKIKHAIKEAHVKKSLKQKKGNAKNGNAFPIYIPV